MTLINHTGCPKRTAHRVHVVFARQPLSLSLSALVGMIVLGWKERGWGDAFGVVVSITIQRVLMSTKEHLGFTLKMQQEPVSHYFWQPA